MRNPSKSWVIKITWYSIETRYPERIPSISVWNDNDDRRTYIFCSSVWGTDRGYEIQLIHVFLRWTSSNMVFHRLSDFEWIIHRKMAISSNKWRMIGITGLLISIRIHLIIMFFLCCYQWFQDKWWFWEKEISFMECN